MQAARDRQKSYADLKRKPMEFQIGDRVMLKVSPWKGILCFGKQGKLNPIYVGTYKVLDKVRTVAYMLELPQELSRVHNTFHVSSLKKCHADEPLVVPLDGLHFDDKLHFVEELIEIMDREVKRLNRICIPLVKVAFGHCRDALSVVIYILDYHSLEGTSFTQRKVPSIPFVFSWGGSISHKGFLTSILLLVVIIVAVVVVVVAVILVVFVGEADEDNSGFRTFEIKRLAAHKLFVATFSCYKSFSCFDVPI
nr:putative reverse transcriptase domain-containing protein [Tanacetum cinerariifolium]